MRRISTLSGTWQFQLDPAGSFDVGTLSPDREIPVPLPWQAAFPELQEYSGYAWYRRTFDLDADWLDGEVLLHFGAVDYWCQVFVNGALAGEHEGGYTPFTLPVASLLNPGQNEVAVRVFDAAQAAITIPRWRRYGDGGPAAGPPFDPEDIPHGKQEWYMNVGGIWQDVTLTSLPRTYVRLVHVTPDIATGDATVRFEVAGTGAESAHVTISDDDTALEQPVPMGQGSATLRVEQPRLWSLEDPHLYTATVTVRAGAPGVEDSLSVRFGFREISTRDGKLLLNGEPIFLLSALDQDMYVDTIYTVPSEEYLRDQFRKAKELGLNNLRCHIKPPDPLYLDLADEMGLLVWAEIPSWRTFYIKGTMHAEQLDLGEPVKQRVRRTLEEMVRRDYNHPSLVIWTIVNEDWGTSLPLSAADREWVLGMYDHCKELDPTRLVVDNSPCPHPWGPNIHVKSDLDDFHIYANIPDQARRFERTMDQFNLRPLWTYSSHGDAVRTGQEPLVLSEFGNWGLPSLRKLREPYGDDPPWFGLGPWWNSWEGEGGWPSGVEERFALLGLESIWGDYERFATATQMHQFHALKFEIEAMRRQSALAGYVITELSDIYWESNGLLDFHRNPKVFHDLFPSINAPDVIVPQPAAHAYWDDERAVVRLHAAHYSASDWAGARLRWAMGEAARGEKEVPEMPRGTAAALGVMSLQLPTVERTTEVQIAFAMQGTGGVLARNSLDLLVVPAAGRVAAYTEPVAVLASATGPNESVSVSDRPPEGIDWVLPEDLSGQGSEGEGGPGHGSLQSAMRGMGYHTASHLTPGTGIAVANRANEDLLKWVRAGGRLLYLGDGPSPFFWVQNRGGAYSGSWLTSFTWLRPDVHRRLPVNNPVGLPFKGAMPTSTILGLPVEDAAVQPDFLAGMVSGWVGHPAVHTVRFRYGEGCVIMTTFRLVDWLGTDPVATAMFHDLVDHLASEECRPTLRANY